MNLPPESVAVFARAIERIIICLAAASSLVMGWNLFRIGVVNPQSGSLSGKGWGIKLQRCGPGIFFALFGTVVFVWSLYSPLNIGPTNVSDKQQSATAQQPGIHYFGNNATESLILAQSIARVSTSWKECEKTLQPNADPVAKEGFLQTGAAMTNLIQWRASAIDAVFGTAKHAKYREMQGQPPEKYGEADRETYKQISEWYKPLESK